MYSNLYSDDIKSSIEWGYNKIPFTKYIHTGGDIIMEKRDNSHVNSLLAFKVGLDETSKWVDSIEEKYIIEGNKLVSNKQEIDYHKTYIKFSITVEKKIITIIYDKNNNYLKFESRDSIQMPLYNFKILLEANKFFLKQVYIYKNAEFIGEDM